MNNLNLNLLFSLLLFTFPALADIDLTTAAGIAWQELVVDSLDVDTLPSGDWKPSNMPTKIPWKSLNSADGNFAYSTAAVDKYFDADGSFHVKTRRAIWFRATVDVPAESLKDRTAHFTTGPAGYKTGLWVNGRFVGEDLFATFPHDWDVTAFLKPGKNEIAIGCTVREGLVDPVGRFYRAPSNGAALGVCGPVRLAFRPLVTVDDVFVRTYSNSNLNLQPQPALAIDITVKNDSEEPVRVVPRVRIFQDNSREYERLGFDGDETEVPAHGTKTVTLKRGWANPRLWSPQSPTLYVAEVDIGTDRIEQTFGFREFTRKGKDFLLNGKRIVLIRKSSLHGMGDVGESSGVQEVLKDLHQVNCIRQHLGMLNASALYAADRTGMLMTPESAYSWKHCFPMDERREKWLPGVLEYYDRWVKSMRNHPSVVMYNLANETYWDSTNAVDGAVTARIAERVRELDPTRLLEADGDNGWGSSLDVINVHYPEGEAGTLRLKYPNASCIVPNDFEWLTEAGGEGWRTRVVWDRPLFLGEFGFGLSDDNYSSVVGDAYYTWTKWQGRAMCESNDNDVGAAEDNPFTCYLRSRIVSLRDKGAAGLNPWGGQYSHVIRLREVQPVDFGANVVSGGTFRRTFAVFNDATLGSTIEKLNWSLYLDGALHANGSAWCGVAEGRKKRVTLELPMPKTVRPLKGELVVRACCPRGKALMEVARCAVPVNVFPVEKFERFEKGENQVEGGRWKVEQRTDRNSIVQPSTFNLQPDSKVRVIGRDEMDFSKTAELDEFVAAGGVAIVLPQKDWKPWRPDVPARDALHAQSKCWVRAKAHPAMADIDDSIVQYWGASNVVTCGTFLKPTVGAAIPLIDCGGRYGLAWSPLLECPYGKGAYLFTTLELDKEDAGARWIFRNLVQYARSRKPAVRQPLNSLFGTNGALRDVLTKTGAVVSEGVGESGPVLVDGSAEFACADLEKALDAGRDVWLHGFTEKTFGKVAPLLPAGTRLEPAPNGILAGEPVSAHPFVRGLSAFDLAWYRRTYTSNNSLFENASVQAKAGDWVLAADWFGGAAEKLTTPAFLSSFASRRGRILFDTLAWETAAVQEPEKAPRTAAILAANLGVDFRFAPKKFYRFSPVDLRPAANMGYLDPQAGDGTGGWMDDGRADMRYFLVNHAGTGNGELDGMAVDTEKFPTDVRFNEVAFHLDDPKENGGKAVVAFGSDKRPAIRLRETGPLAVGRKAEKLCFLHATGWGSGKKPAAHVTLAYEDGTRAEFDLVNDVDVGDWFNLKKLSNAKIAWAGKNLEASSVGVYMSEKPNPHPEKTIRSISVKGFPENCQYVLLAITLATEDATQASLVAPREKSYLKVDFARPGACALKSVGNPAKAPAPTADGLRYRHGQQNGWVLEKEEQKTCLAEPYGVLIDFTPEEAPDGWCSGLVNLGPVRVTMRNGKPHVVFEGWNAGKRVYVQSKEPVVYGKRVRFEFVNDGKTLKLYRDDRLDAMAPATLETGKECAFVTFGVAGGKDYNFNGVMHAAEFYRLAR